MAVQRIQDQRIIDNNQVVSEAESIVTPPQVDKKGDGNNDESYLLDLNTLQFS